MSNIKVGDYVEVTTGVGPIYFAGAGGRVIAVNRRAAQVWFTHGQFDRQNKGCWWVALDKLRITTPYSSHFTEPAEAEPTTGHVANGGGLQKHSVGDIYPLAVVGYAKGVLTRYTVENLETGEVACYGNQVRCWPEASLALAFAKALGEGRTVAYSLPVTWLKGRPIYDLNWLVFDTTKRTLPKL